MKVAEKNGFEIHIPTSGGKAGKGKNLTTSIQIRKGGAIVHAVRFKLDDEASKAAAVAKVKHIINGGYIQTRELEEVEMRQWDRLHGGGQ